jgi:transcriptional regulator with XRE-family HTH domain
VSSTGTQTAIAAAAGISGVRLSQILSGKGGVAVVAAAALEDTLGVDRGSLFVMPDAGLAAPYARPDAPPGAEGAAA